MNGLVKAKNDSLQTAILFWCGLVIVSSLYVTIPLVSVFSETFKVTTAQAAWTGSAFSLFYALGFLFFGPLSDRFGRKQMILIGLILLTLISPVLGIVDHFILLVILRSLQGMAAATFAPAALAYVVERFPVKKRVTTIGFVSTGFLMAGIAGQVYSSFVSQQLGWKNVFYILGAIYLMTSVLVALILHRGERQDQDQDLLAPVKQMGRVLTKKPLILCYLITITLLLAFVGMYTTLGNYLDKQFGLTSQHILTIRAIGVIGMLFSPMAGRLVARFGIQYVLRGGLTLAVLGLALLGFSSTVWVVGIMSVLFVTGISVTVPTLISWVGQLGGEARGVAVSLYTFILFIGATLGPIVAIWFLQTGSYLFTFEMLALVLSIGLFTSFFIRPDHG